MTLFEQYKNIYEKLLAVGREYGLLHDPESAGQAQEDHEKQQHVQRLNELLEQIEKYREDLEDIMRIVEPHITSRNFLNTRQDTTARGDGKKDLLQERELNFSRLKRWASRIDPMNIDDPYAQRMYIQIICNQKYLNRKEKEFRDRLEAVERSDASTAMAASKTKAGRKKIAEILDSSEFAAFVSALTAAHKSYQSDPAINAFPTRLPADNAQTILGCYVSPLPVPPEFRAKVKEKLDICYDVDSSTILLPLEQSLARDVITVYSSDQMKVRITRQSIQRCLFGYAVNYPLGNLRIKVLDALHYNNSWLGPLKSLEGSVLIDEVPGNEQELMDALRLTVAEFSDTDELLQTEDSVAEYNQSHEGKPIARQVLVLVGYPDAFPSQAQEYVNRIMVNHEHYGITVIIYHARNAASSHDDLESYKDYLDATLITLTAQDQTVMRYDGKPQQFRVYPPITSIPEKLRNMLRDYEHRNLSKGELYEERIGLAVQHTRGQKKDIEVVLGVDQKGDIPRISFRNENFAAFLMGASGSGKSTMLHVIITYLIQHYHPDDVELWLADFKMSEFAQYVHPMPPHVKYILLDESAELVIDFIDKLNEEMQSRQSLFKSKGWKDIKDVKNCYLPVIFVIIDEFSIMSQVLQKSMDYMPVLQNLLSKGRALGFKFIFASQDYSKGIGGLTAMAKDQIQRRIAMKNSYDEIRDALELRSSAITEQVQAWMEALPAHYAMVKDHETSMVSRLKTLYFPGKDAEEAYLPQRRMIESMLQNMEKTEYTADNNGALADPNAYIDKHGLVVDGNTFQGYHPEKLNRAAAACRLADPCILPDDKLLCPGRPRRLNEYGFITLTRERRENILLLGRRQEWPCTVSVITSLCRQFSQQGGKTQIWTFHRNHMYMIYREILETVVEDHVLTTQQDVCTEIHKICEKIHQGVPGDDLIILLGADRLFEELENSVQDDTPTTTVDHIQLQGLLASSDEMEEILNHGQDESDNDASVNDNLALLAVFQKKGSSTQAEQTEQQAVSPAATSMSIEEMLAEIFRKGSTMGYHIMVCAEQYPEIKEAGINPQVFRHKIGFSMTDDDSISIFGKRDAARIGQHVCLYENGTEGWSLRPYIHKEIQWDDWSYNETTGEAIQILREE